MPIPTISPALIDLVRTSQHMVVLTGAGISAESGVPTFREAQTGLWAQYNPEELATPEAFQHNPRLVWEWYTWRRNLVSQVEPNPGHFALVELERHIPKFTLITQNVDGLHHRAGSRDPIELHGNIQRTRCFREGNLVDSWSPTTQVPPQCPQCGGLLRPDVVWFGENLPQAALSIAFNAIQNCDIFLSVGTSALVQPAASLPLLALEVGAKIIEINPDTTPLTPYTNYTLSGLSGEILPAFVQAVWN